MHDEEVLQRISELVEEEHQLESSHVGRGLASDEEERLRQIKVALDQCWDLLRQRRARRASGQDPDQAEVRSEAVVQKYRQ
jgi:hypothetical protein